MTIKYLNKDFTSFKRDLIKFSEAHHSGVFQDFNESSPGMALLELNAYVADNLSFYIDQSFSELKQETARQEKNVVSFAKSLGYRPRGNRASQGELHWIIEVPAATNGIGDTVPDDTFSPILRKGSKAEGPGGVIFETLDNIHFSASIDREVTGSQFDSSTGLPTHFALRKPISVIAGESTVDTVTIGDFEQFKTIELANENVIEVISVLDSDGNEWTEVEYLAQETVFDSDVNVGDDSNEVPFIMKLLTVPRRFITDRDPETGKTSLVFGSGDGINFDDELVPNLADLALPLAGRATFSSVALDPQNFLKTRSLGLSPFNTTMTITYRIGGGSNTNISANLITDVKQAVFDFSSTGLNPIKKSNVEGSVGCINLKKTDGGGPPETISEIKANSGAYFAAQNRMVSKPDFIARIKSLPERFGKPEKVFPRKNNTNALALDVHILTRDENGHLAKASTNLKNNIKTYISKYRMLTDGINLLDGDIVNLKLNFGVVVAPKFNRSEVLTKCIDAASDYLDTHRLQIGQPIILSDLSAEIQSILGVISVYELKFTNAVGLNGGLRYSESRFDVTANTQNSIIYCPDNSIFEIKYPRRDIIGVGK